ncbi:MAG: histidine phosphatase family protein, partial [Planctomycetaceae bacterium]
MLDRESTFADPEIVKLLKTRFIPVAIDQAYQRRQQDTEGEFYRKIAGQGPRSNFQATTQGFYVATATGGLLLYNNNRDPAKVRRLLGQKLAEFLNKDEFLRIYSSSMKRAMETAALVSSGRDI